MSEKKQFPENSHFKWSRSVSARVHGARDGTVDRILNKYRGFKLAEIEATEACEWMRAAGFPQYAQMYEESLFPVDITSIQRDHSFLDDDSIQSLIRRLLTLNKCARMKISTPENKTNDSDDEESCALSNKWTYENNCHRWSRNDAGHHVDSSEPASDSPDQVTEQSDACVTGEKRAAALPDYVTSTSTTKTSHFQIDDKNIELYMTDIKNGVPTCESWDNNHDSTDINATSPRLRRAASDRFKGATKNFFRRLESIKDKKSRPRLPAGKVDISGPVLIDSPDIQETIERMGCVDISPSSDLAKHKNLSLVSPPESPQNTTIQKLLSNNLIEPEPCNNFPSLNTSDVDQCFTLDAEYKPGSFPKLINNGAISNGTQHHSSLHFTPMCYPQTKRTDCDRSVKLHEWHECDSYINNQSGDSLKMHSVSQYNHLKDQRLSVYDNVSMSDIPEPQSELDLVLNDLLASIGGLTQNLNTEQDNDGTSIVKNTGVNVTSTNDMGRITEDSETTNTTCCAMGDQDGSLSLSEQLEAILQECNHSLLEAQKMENDCGGGDSLYSQPNLQSPEQFDNSSLLGTQKVEDDCFGGDILCLQPDYQSPQSQDIIDNVHSNQAIGSSSSSSQGSDIDIPRSQTNGSVSDTRKSIDSGVYPSPIHSRRRRLRWHSFIESHRPSLSNQSLQMSGMSVGQLMVIRKLCLLKVTSLMEKYSPSSRTGWNWAMPKFIKRSRAPDYKEKNVFGVPLSVMQQRTGQPLPQCMLCALRCLRRNAEEAVGIFRKSGVRSRIQKLRSEMEADPDSVDFDELQSYDVADLLKQYFRDLPECLLTNKLSETFTTLYTYVPAELRLVAIQAIIMLMPDENLQVLQCLLLFLSDMAQHAKHNQMTASNLAVCFAPSLFHICGTRSHPDSSPKRNRKNLGVPDQKELLEQKAAHECLTQMILNCEKLFQLSEWMISSSPFSCMKAGSPMTIEELGKKISPNANYTLFVDTCIEGLLKEAHDKFKGWVSVSYDGCAELAYKKICDGHPLRLWKTCVDIGAPPVDILNRLFYERKLWDEDYVDGDVVEKVDGNTDVVHFTLSSMAPHPARDFCELRSWRTNLLKGSCVLISTSVEHEGAVTKGTTRAVTLASRYLIEPCGTGKSRLTHITRVDLRGYTPEWYNRVFGHICANNITRIQESFRHKFVSTGDRETRL